MVNFSQKTWVEVASLLPGSVTLATCFAPQSYRMTGEGDGDAIATTTDGSSCRCKNQESQYG